MNPDTLNNQNPNNPSAAGGETVNTFGGIPAIGETPPEAPAISSNPLPKLAMPLRARANSKPATSSPAPKTNPNSTQNALMINEIRDGIVIMNDGSFRSVVMLKSINYDLMSPEEQEGVEMGYQAFLNSLYFPIQIFIHSQKVDIGQYIAKLSKIRSQHDNMLLAMLMEDYIDFMVDLAEQTNIMDKKFYIIIPYFPKVDTQKAVKASKNFLTGIFGKKEQAVTINEADLAAATEELRNRVQATLSGLQQCGVQGLPLDTQELIELYYDAYNPDTATRQRLSNFADLTVPVVTKGEGTAQKPNLNEGLEN
jgi:hypothetical protein